MTKRTVAKTRPKTKARTERAKNKPPARSADGRSEQPVTDEIRRAAKRAGIPPREPEGITFHDYMQLDQGQQLEKLLRQVGHTDDAFISEQLRIVARQFADHAFKLHLGGIGVMTEIPALGDIRAHLIRICDRLSEMQACLRDLGNLGDGGNVEDKLSEALLEAWRLRWELGSGADEIREVQKPTTVGGAS